MGTPLTLLVFGYVLACLIAYALVLTWTQAGSYQWEDETIPDQWWFEAMEDSLSLPTWIPTEYVHRSSVNHAVALCRSYTPPGDAIRVLPRPQVILTPERPCGAPGASNPIVNICSHSCKTPCKGRAKVGKACKRRAGARNAPNRERVTLRVLSE